MAEFGKTQALQAQAEKRPERAALIRRGENGVLQMVRPKAATADALGKTTDAYRVSSYFRKVFNPSSSELRKPHEVMDCFYCADIQYHHVEMEVAEGISYPFSFACVCNKEDNAGSIMDLVRRELFTLECQAWEVCKLKGKENKCQVFSCRRFP